MKFTEFISKTLEKWSCKHRWEKHYESAVFQTDLNGQKIGELPIRREQTLICQECGKIKKIYL